MAGLPSATWLDLVVGCDFHVVMVPTPPGAFVPVLLPHVYMGLAGDPAGLAVSMAIAPVMSLILEGKLKAPPGPVMVNGRPRLTTNDLTRNTLLLPHLPIVPGGFFQRPPSGEGQHHLGDLTVVSGGGNAVRAGERVFTCADPLPAPTSSVLVLPKGPPVLAGGPSGINPVQAATKYVMGRAFRVAFKGISKLARFVGRLSSRRLRNIVPKDLCTTTGHPIDVATGKVITDAEDFSLPGPIPLSFARDYSSAWATRRTSLGWGWSHSLDRTLWVEEVGVVCRRDDGRELVFGTEDFPDGIPVGARLWDEVTALQLERTTATSWVLTSGDGAREHFEELDDEPSRGDQQRHLARCTRIETRDRRHAIKLAWRKGRLISATDCHEREIRFSHDLDGNLTQVDLPHPVERDRWVTHASFEYSPDGDLLVARDAHGSATRYSYVRRLMTKEVRRNGVRFLWAYDGISSDARCVRTWGYGAEEGAPAIFHQRLLYDPSNRKTWRIDGDGNQTEFQANELGLVTMIRDGEGGITRREYDGFRIVKEIDPNGGVTSWTYSPTGDCTSTVAADGGKTETTFEGPWPSRPSNHRVFRGGTWRYTHDAEGHLVLLEGPEGLRESWSWESGQVVKHEVLGRGTTTFGYNGRGELATVRLPTGAALGYIYDRRGQIIAIDVTMAPGDIRRVWSAERDLLGRIVFEKEANGNVSRYAYDNEGNVTRVSDSRVERAFTYCGFDWLASVTEGGDTVNLAYHSEGELKEIRNEHGNTYSFLLDACRRIKEERPFDVRAYKTHKRDKSGLIVATTHHRRNGVPIAKTKYTYDPMGRMTRVEHDDGTWSAYAYELDGSMVRAENAVALVEMRRDLHGRVVEERSTRLGEEGPADVIWYRYDASGGLVELRSSLGARMVAARDPMTGLVSALHIGDPEKTKVLALAIRYDALGREIARDLPGDLRATWDWHTGGMPRRRAVETARPVEALSNKPLGESRDPRTWSRTYHWQPGERLEAIDDSRFGRSTFKHDSRGRFYSETRNGETQYRVMDAVGNVYRTPDRSDRSYTFGGMLRWAGDEEFEYEELGRMVRRTNKRNGRSSTYKWNREGALVQVTTEIGAFAYAYDALGRRLMARGRRWIYAGNDLLHEVSDSGPLRTWVRTPDCWDIAADVLDGGCVTVIGDYLGTAIALYAQDGLPEHLEYDSFGSLRKGAAKTPWRWLNQYADAETSINYNRFRYYDPTIGIYITPDPLGLVGGTQLYASVNDPLVSVDYLGLIEEIFVASIKEALRRAADFAQVPRLSKGGSAYSLQSLDPRSRGPNFRQMILEPYWQRRGLGRQLLKGDVTLAEFFFHPDGHPDEPVGPTPDHYKYPHVNAKNRAGQKVAFMIKPGCK